MTPAEEILHKIQQSGCSLEQVGNQVVVRGRKMRLSPRLLEEVELHKEELSMLILPKISELPDILTPYLSLIEAAYALHLPRLDENNGIWIDADYMMTNPNGIVLCHVIGIQSALNHKPLPNDYIERALNIIREVDALFSAPASTLINEEMNALGNLDWRSD